MTAPAAPQLPPAGVRSALFLDIDGTLLEHQVHPEAVRVDQPLRDLLDEAIAVFDGAVAFVTGRSIGMVDRLFAPLHLPTAGLYGLEHRTARDGPVTRAEEPADLAAVADALQRRFHTTEGIYFERKGPVLAIHTRAAPAALPSVRAAAETALAGLPQGYRIVVGNAGLEFLPLDALKSAAIERFRQEAQFADRLPIFIGDDVSDEAGFEYVNGLGGISVRVRPAGPTAAGFVLPDVAAVRRWIAELIRAAKDTVR